jgi:hypothetical protein
MLACPLSGDAFCWLQACALSLDPESKHPATSPHFIPALGCHPIENQLNIGDQAPRRHLLPDRIYTVNPPLNVKKYENIHLVGIVPHAVRVVLCTRATGRRL